MPTSKVVACLLGILVPCFSTGLASARTTYNAVKMFNLQQNPQAPWGYYVAGTILGTFNPQVHSVAGLQGWTDGAPEPSFAVIAKNRAKSSTIHYGEVFVPAVFFLMDPETKANVFVRFVAPNSGNYRIKAKFLGLDQREQSHTVEVRHNNVAFITFTMAFNSQEEPIRDRIALAAGDTLDFVCNTAGDGSHLSTGVAITLTGP